jgi:hypothetical protein
LEAESPKCGAFAASNSSLLFSPTDNVPSFVTGGPHSAFFYGGMYQALTKAPTGDAMCKPHAGKNAPHVCLRSLLGFQLMAIPVIADSESSGAFSIAAADLHRYRAVVVGGDYTKPDNAEATASYLDEKFEGWLPAQTPPHGYRSTVAYVEASNTWITVGPNGTDISTDDGKNWKPLRPDPARHEAPDADRDWNALSLPFVVGPHGRIGRLNLAALKPWQ